MAPSAQHAEPWFVAAGRMFYDGWNFAQFVSGITLAAWASQVTGVRWSIPLGPWLFVAAALVLGVGIVRVGRQITRRFRILIDRPSAQVTLLSSGTDEAVLEIAHSGAPVTFRAEGRIVRTLNDADTPKPPEHRFSCELQPEEGRKSSTRLTLTDQQWAHIIIAESRAASIHDSGHVLWIRRGSYGRQSRAPDSGVEIEITIHTEPRSPVGTITRRTI
jgi:hypothetical protein